jgi:hypothetical protein
MIRILRSLSWRLGPAPDPTVVVAGMPKSGTTAIAMLLGAAAGLDVNSDPFYRLDRAGVRFRDALYDGTLELGQLVDRYRAFFRGGLIKDPNFIYLPAVFDVFDGAAFVFTVRDPRHNIRSVLNRLRLPGRVDRAPASPTGISDTWRRVLEGRTPDTPGANYVERLAHRWSLAAANYLEHQDRMLAVRYETFSADKEATLTAALAQLDVPGGRPISHLLERQFQPKGQRGATPEEFFGPAELESIERICARELASFGYPATTRNA